MEKRLLVFSDVHGMYDMLVQALERAKYDPAADKLVFLGDLFDRGPADGMLKCVEFLLGVEDKVLLLGNHDKYVLDCLTNRRVDYREWIGNGGQQTIDVINSCPESRSVLLQYCQMLIPYWEHQDMLFVHGGLPTYRESVKDCSADTLSWDRSMVVSAYQGDDVRGYNTVFCGHTPTTKFADRRRTPTKYANVWMVDTGAAYGNVLSIVDARREDFWQSDLKDSNLKGD